LKFVLAGLLSATAAMAISTTANAHAPWKHDPGELKAPLVHYIDFLRDKTNEIRGEKCLDKFRVQYSLAGTMPKGLRPWAAKHWRARMIRAQNAKSKCMSAISYAYGVWDRLASCESGQTWNYNGPSGFDGGLQFHPGTWSAYKLPGYPRYAWQATREMQIRVAERVLAAQGWGAWPACSAKLGLR
jgi:Transglycosylase-like domain